MTWYPLEDACWQEPVCCERCDRQISSMEGHYCAACWRVIDGEKADREYEKEVGA